MVLGMHRSGTSALSRVLQLAGANIGERVTGASRGNEGGHWEDAFAMEIHERLLAAYGSHWDAPFALPAGWETQAPAIEARDLITKYLATTRARHPCWSVKDPRLCHFGGLWRDAAIPTGLPIAALLVVRHPDEVAASLAVRDNMGRGTALLLWLEHTLSALAIAETMPSCILAYDDLLADWRGCVRRIETLVGNDKLDFAGAAEQIDAYLDAGKNHQRGQANASDLPADVAHVWHAVAGLAVDGDLPTGTTQRLKDALSGSVELLRDHATRTRRSELALLRAIEHPDSVVACSERMLPPDLLPQHAAVLERFNAAMHEQPPDETTWTPGTEQEQAGLPSNSPTTPTIDPEVRVREAIVQQEAATQRAIALEARVVAAEQRADGETHRAIVAETSALSAQARQQLLEERVQASESKARDVETARRNERRMAELLIERLQQRIVDADARETAANAALAERDDMMRSLLASKSWQVTRPLRVLARVLRGDWETFMAGWKRWAGADSTALAKPDVRIVTGDAQAATDGVQPPGDAHSSRSTTSA